MKFKRIFATLLCACLVASLCVVGVGCSASADKYKTVYKYTNEAGKDVYDWPAGSETGMIDVPGGKVQYRVYGKGKPGIPIVYVHGGPGGNYSAAYKQLPLAEERPIILYDQLGSPYSEISAEYNTKDNVTNLFTIDRFCEELDCVVKYFELNEFALLGSSWGCMLGLEYAAKYQPESLKGIIFTGPFLSVDTWLADAERLILSLDGGQEMLAEVRQCEASGVYTEKFNEINAIFSKNFNNRHKEDMFDRPSMTEGDTSNNVVDSNFVYEYMWGKSEFSCTGTLQHHDSTPLLAKIDVPILYTPGQYDEGTPEAAFYYCSLTKNGEVAVIPGSAHASSQERPVEFNTIVREFLNRL